jgi:hypothetical protein
MAARFVEERIPPILPGGENTFSAFLQKKCVDWRETAPVS